MMWKKSLLVFLFSLSALKAALDCEMRTGTNGPYKCKAQVANCSRYSREFNFTFVDPVTPPMLNIQTETDQYIILHCISLNGSLPINYTFFKNDIAMSPVISKYVREPAEFNLTKKNTGKKEKYRCKAENVLPGHAKYSQSFIMPSTGGDSCPFCLQLLLPGLLLVLTVIILILAFWILPKYKTRKAMRDKVPRGFGKTPTDVGLYANVVDEFVPGLEERQCVSTAQGENRLAQEIHYATPMFQEVTPDHKAHKDDKTGYVYSELTF